MDYFKRFIIVAVTMLVLDGIWLGFVSPQFYFSHMKHLARVSGESIDVNKMAAAIVYLIMVLAFLIFVSPIVSTSSWGMGLMKAAFFGLAIYGVYDFTNMATLRDWSWTLSLVDMAWGGFLFMVTAAVVKFCEQLQWIES